MFSVLRLATRTAATTATTGRDGSAAIWIAAEREGDPPVRISRKTIYGGNKSFRGKNGVAHYFTMYLAASLSLCVLAGRVILLVIEATSQSHNLRYHTGVENAAVFL